MKKVMKREQLIKILKVALISTAILLVSEAIFDIPVIIDWFSGLITSTKGVWVWIVIWAIMFLQVTILNVPAYVILSACVSIGIETLSAAYFFVVLSAYMCGCLLAYWLGYKFGKKAVKWCAGSDEDYNKWSKFLNKKGKVWYLVTIVFPFFPDDLLCIVAGAIKFNFVTYTVFNFIGRGIGLITTLLFLKFVGKMGGGFPIMLVLWFVLLIAELVIFFILKKKKDEDIALFNKLNIKEKYQTTKQNLLDSWEEYKTISNLDLDLMLMKHFDQTKSKKTKKKLKNDTYEK